MSIFVCIVLRNEEGGQLVSLECVCNVKLALVVGIHTGVINIYIYICLHALIWLNCLKLGWVGH